MKRRSHFERKRARAGYVFILPWVIGFLLFFLIPLVNSFYYTFNEVKLSASGFTLTWVGLENYSHLLFSDAEYPQLLGTAVGNMLVEVVIITLFSLLVAVLLNQKFHGRTFYRAVFFLPIIMTSGVVYTLVQSVVNGGTSIGNDQNAFMFQSTGLKELMVQGNVPTDVVNFITNIVDKIFSLLSKSGVQILLFLSGLQKIPASGYEACKIEGASSWDIFWKITVPLISPIVFLNIVYTIIDSFTAYGTTESGNTMMGAIQNMGFGKVMQLSYSATMAWIYFAVIIVFLGIAYWIIGKRVSKIQG